MSEQPRSRRSRPRPRRRGWRYLLASLVLAGGFSLVAAMGAFLVPLPTTAMFAPTLVYDRTGQLIGSLNAGDRLPISYSQLPGSLKDAIVATEDKTFWTNIGVNPVSIVRAAAADVLHGRIVQGGSTITQELAKNLFLTEQQTVGRKFAELFLALRLAATFPKRDVLSMYFNTVYFGEGAWGIGRAAQVYFGVPVRNLSLPQSALLAGLVAAPSAYDPYHSPKLALSRRNWVLERMHSVGYITLAQMRWAEQQPIQLSGALQRAPIAPYAFDAIVQEMQTRDPSLASALMTGGYRIYSTLSLADQRAADQAMADQIPPATGTWQGAPEPEAALVSIDPRTGGIAALVGGRDYATAPFDRAMNAYRQPGSTFKAFLYAALIGTKHYTAASVMDDNPVQFVGVDGRSYSPTNAGGERIGPMTVRRALAMSNNVVAIKWADIVGPQAVINVATGLGITVPLPSNLTIALGSASVSPVQMAQAYSALANGGTWTPAHLVTRIVSPTGQVVYRFSERPHVHAISPQVAYIMTKLLEGVFGQIGTGNGLANNLNFAVAGKTGTTNNLYDGWFVGYSSRLSTAVWVGYDDPNHALSAQGAGTGGPIWSEYMQLAENQNPPPNFHRPGGVVMVPISTLDGLLPNYTEPAVDEWFIRGTQPKTYSPIDYTGPWTLWPKNTGLWYFATYGPPKTPTLWSKLMAFPGQSPTQGQGP